MKWDTFADGAIDGAIWLTAPAIVFGVVTPDVLITLAVALAATVAGAGRVVEHLPRALDALSAFVDKHGRGQ